MGIIKGKKRLYINRLLGSHSNQPPYLHIQLIMIANDGTIRFDEL